MGPELLFDRAERACSAAGCDQGRPNGDGVKGEASDEVKVRLPGEDLAGLLKKNGCAVQAKPSYFVGKLPRGLVVRLVRELECAANVPKWIPMNLAARRSRKAWSASSGDMWISRGPWFGSKRTNVVFST